MICSLLFNVPTEPITDGPAHIKAELQHGVLSSSNLYNNSLRSGVPPMKWSLLNLFPSTVSLKTFKIWGPRVSQGFGLFFFFSRTLSLSFTGSSVRSLASSLVTVASFAFWKLSYINAYNRLMKCDRTDRRSDRRTINHTQSLGFESKE